MSKRTNKKSNYERKKDLLESSYVDGAICPIKGKVVIRPLTEEEAAWLNKFNDEFVNTNISKNQPNLHDPLIAQNKARVQALKAEIKVISEELKSEKETYSGWRTMNFEQRQEFSKYKKELYIKKAELTEELESCDIVGNIYRNNYARGMDISNYTTRTVKIADLERSNFEFQNYEFVDTKECNESKLFESLKVINKDI